MRSKNPKQNKSRPAVRLWAVLLWLAVWQIAAMALNQDIFLVTPVKVLERLWELGGTWDFWSRLLSSSASIMGGLLLGAVIGIVLGILSSLSSYIKQLLAPLISVIRAIPVASFIILAVVWLDSSHLGQFISLLICLPVFYTNTLTGIASADKKLLEMAKVFRLSPFKKIRAIYMPALVPYLKAACDVAVGLAWKSGTAAEVIAIPAGSIGEKLYRAKVYYETGDMLAWTLAIVVLSGLFSFIIKRAMMFAVGRLSQEDTQHD